MSKRHISRKKRHLLFATIIFIALAFSVINYIFTPNIGLIDDEKQNLHTSKIVTRENIEWIENTNFSDPIDPWYSQSSGDTSDVLSGYVPGEGYYKIIGEEKTFSDISGIPLNSEWTRVVNLKFPDFPITAEIRDGEGCYVSHLWGEQSRQSPSVHWDRNITMPVNMSDYLITSVSISAVINGTVIASPGSWSGQGIECPGDITGLGGTQNYTWDYARFYVLLSDLTKEKEYEIAYYQTVDLGQDDPEITSLSDTLLNIVPQTDLIYYLTSVLASDNYNFTLTLGIRLWCEDNFYSDEDNWQSLLIKSCDFSFTYEKKVDQFTKVSWNHIGNRLSGQNITILEGNLQFEYKISQLWDTALSPNTKIKILINDNALLETIKLGTAESSFKEAKVGGFDVTKLLLKDVNISLSIQLFLGDEYPLNQNYTLSITNVSLRITYTIFVPETEEEPWLFTGLFIIAAIAAAVISGLLIAYIKVWRFPIPIRKLRKHRKALPSEKGPDVKIISREAAFKGSFHKEVSKTSKLLKGPPLDGKIEKEKLFRKEAEKPIKK